MKDRTLIILAVAFLVFTVGSGVNKSLEEGNRMMGKDMAPELRELVKVTPPWNLIEWAKGYVADFLEGLGEAINEKYVQLVAGAEKIELKEKKEEGIVLMREKLADLQAKAKDLLAAARERVLAKKNEQAQ